MLATGTAAAQNSPDDLFAPAAPAPPPPRPQPTASPVEPVPLAPERAHDVEQALGPGEHDVNLEDRVKAVPRKGFIKAHRVSVSGLGSASLTDAFFQKWGGGGQLAYSFTDPFALSLSYAYFHDQTTYNVNIAKQVLSSQLFVTRLHSVATADFQWTPVSGKFKFFNSIGYLDFYPFAGFGVAQGETNWSPAAEVGLGERVFLTDFLSVGLEAKYDLYTDQAANGPSVLQRVLLLNALVSIWFPGAPEGPSGGSSRWPRGARGIWGSRGGSPGDSRGPRRLRRRPRLCQPPLHRRPRPRRRSLPPRLTWQPCRRLGLRRPNLKKRRRRSPSPQSSRTASRQFRPRPSARPARWKSRWGSAYR